MPLFSELWVFANVMPAMALLPNCLLLCIVRELAVGLAEGPWLWLFAIVTCNR